MYALTATTDYGGAAVSMLRERSSDQISSGE